jgi:tRNA(Ile)-lysidine synthase
VLMRILRGSGLLGLRGILSNHEMKDVRLVRPLLGATRQEIEKYLKNKGSKFCHDITNDQTHYLRNKIRLKLLPQLAKEYNPNISSVMVDLAHTTQTDYEYILQQAKKSFKEKVARSPAKVTISSNLLFKQHISLRRMLLRLSFEHLAGDFNQLSFVHLREVDDLLSNRPEGSVVDWPQSIKVLKTKKELVLFK